MLPIRRDFSGIVVSVCYAVMLMLFAFRAVPALAVETTVEGTPVGIASMVVARKNLYLLSTEGMLSIYDVDTGRKEEVGRCQYVKNIWEQEQPTSGELPTASFLYEEKNQLYGLDLKSGKRCLLVDAEGAFLPQNSTPALDVTGLHQMVGNGSLGVSSVGVQDDGLFLTVHTFVGSMQQNVAIRFDLTTGECRIFATQNLCELIPWKDGKLLCRVYDEGTRVNPQTGGEQKARYGLFDPTRDAVEILGDLCITAKQGTLNMGRLCADVEAETMYYATAGRVQVQKLFSDDTVLGAYTGEGAMFGFGTNGQALYFKGSYIRSSVSDGLSVHRIDAEAAAKGALRVLGEWGGDAHNRFVRAHPEIPVEAVGASSQMDMETLSRMLVTGSETYDVLKLSMKAMPVDTLMEKGYCMDLTLYPAMMELLNRMPPVYRQAVQRGDAVYAMPVEANAYLVAVHLELWDALGLPESQIPQSMIELLEFTSRWVRDGEDKELDINLFSISTNLHSTLLSAAFEHYVNNQQAMGQRMKFDTKEFRELLAAIAAIDFAELEASTRKDGYGNEVPALFNLYLPVAALGEWGTWQPLFLADAGSSRRVPVELMVLIVNPKTERKEQAIQYVVEYLNCLDDGSQNILLYSDQNAPVEREGFAKEWEQAQKELKELQARRLHAEESKQAELEQQIQWQEELIQTLWENRYSVTQERIAFYRNEIEPFLWIGKPTAFENGSLSTQREWGERMEQYAEGVIDAEAWIAEMERCMWMMGMEGQ